MCFYPLPDNFLTDFFFKSKYCYYLEVLKENYFPEILVKIHGCVEEKNIYIYIFALGEGHLVSCCKTANERDRPN